MHANLLYLAVQAAVGCLNCYCNNKSSYSREYLFVSLLRSVQAFHRTTLPAHDIDTFTSNWTFKSRKLGSVIRNRQVTSRTRDATHRGACMHLCIRPRSLYAGMQMRHAQPGSAVRNPFPTLVMAGIVNSIASELDAVGASRKSRSVECSLRHVLKP